VPSASARLLVIGASARRCESWRFPTEMGSQSVVMMLAPLSDFNGFECRIPIMYVADHINVAL
jgi:hypothetical protein